MVRPTLFCEWLVRLAMLATCTQCSLNYTPWDCFWGRSWQQILFFKSYLYARFMSTFKQSRMLITAPLTLLSTLYPEFYGTSLGMWSGLNDDLSTFHIKSRARCIDNLRQYRCDPTKNLRASHNQHWYSNYPSRMGTNLWQVHTWL